MEPLSTTLDPAAPYHVVAVAEPLNLDWLNLPAIHARLLPLAIAAGHDQLLLTVQIGSGLPIYEADASGGTSGFRRYIGVFDYGSTPSQFERVLTEKLAEQQRFLESQP